jgi:hypothetical protein
VYSKSEYIFSSLLQLHLEIFSGPRVFLSSEHLMELSLDGFSSVAFDNWLSPGVKQPQCDVDHTPWYCAKVNNVGGYACISPICLEGVVCTSTHFSKIATT